MVNTSEHHYQAIIEWTGNLGVGTDNYKAYSRNYLIKISGKEIIKGSSDPAFRGDLSRFNPEELLLASLSSCHMLWYLHLCAQNKIVVEAYSDEAEATMLENEDGSGYFKSVILKPVVTIAHKNVLSLAEKLHIQANKMCFIANSVNFEVHHKPGFLFTG